LRAPYSRIRPEPPAADSAWSLPSLWHRDDSSSSSRKGPRRCVRSECLRHFWRVRTGHFWGRRSHHPFRAYRAGARWCKEARRDAGLLVRALVRAANWKIGAIGNVSRRRQISKPRLDMCPVRLGSLGAECGNRVCIRSKQLDAGLRRSRMRTFPVYVASLALLVVGILVGCSQAPTKSPEVSDAIRKSLDQAGLKEVSIAQDREKGVVTL